MGLNSSKRERLFSLLDRLDDMEPEDLLKEFTEEILGEVRILAGELNEELVLERVISENRFLEIIGDLAETNRIWARRYEETVNLAGKAVGEGKTEQACWLLDGFLRFCPSPYYREMAEKNFDEVQKEVNEGTGD